VTSSDNGRGLHEVVDSLTTPGGGKVGWLSAKAPELPQYLTLTLAAPESVARVVVHSVGVSVCRVQARRADGWVTVAELAPTDSQPCEARFAPVRAAAIRLRVLETRADRFQVYEVEAYGP
jgi:hypothetical protein